MIAQPEPRRPSLPLYMGGVEPIIAHRIWRVEVDDGRARLCSVAKPIAWTPGERLQAGCWDATLLVAASQSITFTDTRRSDHHRSPWPDGGCECGIWGLSERFLAVGALWEYARYAWDDQAAWAIGTVKLWGRTVEFEDNVGWRAEYAYPHQVTLLDAKQIFSLIHGPGIAPPEPKLLFDLQTQIFEDYLIPVNVSYSPPQPPEVAPYFAMTSSQAQAAEAQVDRDFRIAGLVLFVAGAANSWFAGGEWWFWKTLFLLVAAVCFLLGIVFFLVAGAGPLAADSERR